MSSNSVCNHTRDKQITLPLRGRPILLSLVWFQTELDSTQSYYHYLLKPFRLYANSNVLIQIFASCKPWMQKKIFPVFLPNWCFPGKLARHGFIAKKDDKRPKLTNKRKTEKKKRKRWRDDQASISTLARPPKLKKHKINRSWMRKYVLRVEMWYSSHLKENVT